MLTPRAPAGIGINNVVCEAVVGTNSRLIASVLKYVPRAVSEAVPNARYGITGASA